MITDTNDAKVAQDFSDALRAVYGVLLSTDIVWNFPALGARGNILIRAVEVDGDIPEYVFVDPADDDLMRTTNFYIPTSVRERHIDVSRLKDIFSPAIKMFKSQDSARLQTSAIWLHRAHVSSRGLDKVLEAAIAIEVLLGDREASDRIGLSKLIANV